MGLGSLAFFVFVGWLDLLPCGGFDVDVDRQPSSDESTGEPRSFLWCERDPEPDLANPGGGENAGDLGLDSVHRLDCDGGNLL